MSSTITCAVRRIRRRAVAAAYLGELALHLAAALFAAGTAILMVRLVTDASRSEVAWLLLIVGLAPLTALWRSSGRFLSRRAAATWLDIRAGSTGGIVTASEIDDARWSGRVGGLPIDAASRPRLRLGKAWLQGLPAILFVAAALWVEMPEAVAGPDPGRLSETVVERAREKLATLEEIVTLDRETGDELDAQLRRIDEERRHADPESTFEAVDRLTSRIEAEARRANEAARAGRESLASTAAAARQDPERAQRELEATLAELREAGLAEGLQKELTERSLEELASAVGEEGTLSLGDLPTERIGQMLEISEELRKLLAERMGELEAAGLVPLGRLALAEGELANLEDFALHECDESCKDPDDPDAT